MRTGFLTGLCILLIAYESSAQTSFPFASSWKYLDNGTNQGTTWRSPGFNDGSWKNGIGKFGWGIKDAATVISSGSDKKNMYITTYFRKAVTIDAPDAFDAYRGSIKRDDGAVVYVNGNEVYRTNMPSGTISNTTLASASGDAGVTAQTFTLNPSAFISGQNVIAVEVHIQSNKPSEKEMAFDLALEGVQIPPTVTSINRLTPTDPTNASSVTYRVTFSEAVTGVGVDDFTATAVTGAFSAASVTGISPVGTDGTTYDITVSSISGSGTLRLDLKSTGTGIVDNHSTAISGGFITGQTFSIDQTPPAVSNINRQTPASATINQASVVYRVTFSEKVTGVDASDFAVTATESASATIAGITAVGTTGTTYDVTLNSVSGNGTLRLDLNASGTGIKDIVGNDIGNGFTSGQTYTIDQTAPITNSINRQSPALQNVSITSVTYRVTFSEGVTGVDARDFSLTVTGGSVTGSVATAVAVAGSNGSTYDVTVSSLNGVGDIRLDLKALGTGIVDLAGNAISGGFTSGEIYSVTVTGPPTLSGFASVTNLTPIDVSSHTGFEPQAKVWTYAGKWWSVLATTNGTKIFRLDGTSWTDVLTLTASNNSKCDVRVVGNVVHCLLFRGASSNSFLVSAEYDAATNSYKLWSQRTARTTIVFEGGTQLATLDIDGNGRMWIASDGVSDINVRWSDAPYTTFSTPIAVASGVTDDDACQVFAMPTAGKIGVFWSNQNTQRWGFKTHTNGDAPTSWSTDEVPASQSALNIRYGMADNHMDVIVASDGTLYCAIKTGYDTQGYPKVALLVRRPAGTWDNLYTVTNDLVGTRPFIILNEAKGKLKIFYTSLESGGDIRYKEALLSNLSKFSQEFTLFSGNYNYTTSTHQTYNPEIAIIATNLNAPLQAVSVLGSDDATFTTTSTAPSVTLQTGVLTNTAERSAKAGNLQNTLFAYPNPFTSAATVNFTLLNEGNYTVSLYDLKGAKISVLQQGWAAAGTQKEVRVDGAHLGSGVYLITLQSGANSKTIKLMVKK